MKRLPFVATIACASALACGPKQSTPRTATGDGTPPPATFTPGEAKAPQFPDEPFRKEQPTAGEPRPFQLPAIKRFQIGKNKDLVDVYLVERHDLPTVYMELNFDGGSMTDPKNKAGLAQVCASMLTEGTASKDKIAFNEALADLASNVSSYASADSQGVSLRSLTKNFPATFELFSESLLAPGMRQSDFDRMVERILDGLKQARGSAASVSARVRGLVRYGENHPFGRIETEKTYGAIRLGDCKAYHKRWFKPRGARLFVVGDLTEQQIKSAFEPLWARWKGGQPRLPRMPDTAKLRPPQGRLFFVNVPGSAQSVVTMMHMGPQRKAPDYFATELAGDVLGGGFSSRVNMNLREDKGYAYGARGGFGYSKWYGVFSTYSSVQANSTYQSLVELHKEVTALDSGERPPQPDELEREKEGAILALPAQFATAAAILGQYRELVYYDLPFDYWNNYVSNIEAVTAEQVSEAAKKHLRPEDAVYLVVGDANAEQIVYQVGEDGKGSNAPFEKDGKPVTLGQALEHLLNSGTLGEGAMVTMDADGKVVGKRGQLRGRKAKAPRIGIPGKAEGEGPGKGKGKGKADEKKAGPAKKTP